MGVYPPGRAKEEDIAHEEEAQTDGWQGAGGLHCFVQVPSLREDQKDALYVPVLHEM